jgi:hypothetical protein
MKNVLMVMHARQIPICIEAIRNLQIPKVWFKGFTEAQLIPEINGFIRSTDYDNYFIISDDGVPMQEALELIENALIDHEVVMGWSEIYPKSWHSNVRTKPLVGWYNFAQRLRLWLVKWGQQVGLQPLINWVGGHSNPFVLLGEPISKVKKQSPLFKTYFNGWSLTGMSRRMWLRYPFSLVSEIGGQRVFGSDYSVSSRMNRDGVEMWCARDAHIAHLHSMAGFFVGKVEPQVIFEDSNILVPFSGACRLPPNTRTSLRPSARA